MNANDENQMMIGEVDILEKKEPDFRMDSVFDYALIKVDNKIARAKTKWNAEELKLFYLSVSKLGTRDEKGWVKLPKADIVQLLNIDARNTHKLRETFVRVKRKSQISLTNEHDEDIWEEGDMIRMVRSDRKHIYVLFEDHYMPYLENLKKAFTAFYPKNIAMLKPKSAIDLYLYLKSWATNRALLLTKRIPKKDIATVFHLEKGQYWRNFEDPDKRKFHWTDFERWCLKPAIQAINADTQCDIAIDRWEKVKDPRKNVVLGYEFHYHVKSDAVSKKEGDEKPTVLEQTSAKKVKTRLKKLSDVQWDELSGLWSTPVEDLRHFLDHPDGDFEEHLAIVGRYAGKWQKINAFLGLTEAVMNDFFTVLDYEREQHASARALLPTKAVEDVATVSEETDDDWPF